MPGALPAFKCSKGGPPFEAEEEGTSAWRSYQAGYKEAEKGRHKPAGKAVKDLTKKEIMALAKKVRFLNLERQEFNGSEQSEKKEQVAPKKLSGNRLNPALERKK